MVGRGHNSQPQIDEVVSVSRRLRNNDLQTCNVILDFQTRSVVLANMDGVTVPKDWTKIRDFYHQHYAKYIDQLENLNAPAVDSGV